MAESTGLTASDVALMTRNEGTFGDDFTGIIMLLIIVGLFGGGWGFGNNAAVASGLTRAEMDSEFSQRDIFNTNSNVLENRYAAAVATGETQKEILENRYANQLGTQSILSNQATCCCENKLLTEQSKYELAQLADRNNFNTLLGNKDLTAAVAADGDKTRALITAQYEAGLLEQINDLKSQVNNQAQTQNIIDTILSTQGRWVGYTGCGSCSSCNCGSNLI